MICSNCGYENNTDDALSCNLCGKVFRKELREEEKKEEGNRYKFGKKPRFYWGSGKKIELVALVLCTIMALFWLTVGIIDWIKGETPTFKDVFWGIIVIIFFVITIWGWLTQTQEEREEELRKERERGLLGIRGITRVVKDIQLTIKTKEDRKAWIFILFGIIIVSIITLVLDEKFDLGIKDSFGSERYIDTYTFGYWVMLVVIGGMFVGAILLKFYEYISKRR